ncbi:MAG: hypothetical protein HKN82_06970 [Akkermansiaceae bacterium]|nr:hypothetical protein [Akkermansiaceae bacterium]
MKTYIITGIAIFLVAHLGSFLTLWKLPFQKDPLTIRTITKGYSKNNLADKRRAYRDEFQALYEKEFLAYNKF